jgi:hypothetical protein
VIRCKKQIENIIGISSYTKLRGDNRLCNVYIVVFWVTAPSSLLVVSNVSVEPTGSPFVPTSAVTVATVYCCVPGCGIV